MRSSVVVVVMIVASHRDSDLPHGGLGTISHRNVQGQILKACGANGIRQGGGEALGLSDRGPSGA